MYNLPVPASLAKLHGRTDVEGLMALIPLLLEKPSGFTPDILLQTSMERRLFPDLDESQIFWKIRRSLTNFQKIGYVDREHTAWYVPNVELIQVECEAAARELGKMLTQISHSGLNLMQAALMGSSREIPAPTIRSGSTLQVSEGLRALAEKGKKAKR